MFVIQRDDGKYVAPPGQHNSYTDRLENAQTFRTKEEAERNRCPENERSVAVDDLIARPSM